MARCILLELALEIQVEILLVCTPHDILALELTCKQMQQLTNNHYVWTSIILRLSDEFAPNIPPHVDINKLGISELKKHVFRALRARDNWSGKAAPKAFRETVIALNNPNGKLGWLSHRNYARTKRSLYIVPGGEYLMVKWSTDALQCYHIGTGKCIWNLWHLDSDGNTPNSRLIMDSFCAEQYVSQDADNLAVLVVGRRPHQKTGIFESLLEIHLIDLRSGGCTMQLRRKLADFAPGLEHTLSFLCGEYIVIVKVKQKSIFIGNWRTARYVKLTYGPREDLDACVEGDYLFCTNHAYRGRPVKLSAIFLPRLLADSRLDTFTVEWPWFEMPLEAAVLHSVDLTEEPISIRDLSIRLFASQSGWWKGKHRSQQITVYIIVDGYSASEDLDDGEYYGESDYHFFVHRFTLVANNTADTYYGDELSLIPSVGRGFDLDSIDQLHIDFKSDNIPYISFISKSGRGIICWDNEGCVKNTYLNAINLRELGDAYRPTEPVNPILDGPRQLGAECGSRLFHLDEYSGSALAYVAQDSKHVVLQYSD